MRNSWVIAACLLAGITQAAVVTKPAVALDVPEGWVEVPAEVLQAFHAELQREAPLQQVPKYDYAFQSKAGPPWLSYPYLLVKVSPSGRPSEHDLETLPTLAPDANAPGDGLGRLLEDTSLGKMRYDKAANVVWLSSKSNVKSVGPVTGISGMLPTEQGFVELHGYAKDADFAAQLPAFQRMITGARVAPHLAYRPHWTDAPGPVSRFDFKWLGWVAAIAILIAVFAGIYRRRRG